MIQLRWGDETVWKDTHFETIEQAKASWAHSKLRWQKLPPDPEFREKPSELFTPEQMQKFNDALDADYREYRARLQAKESRIQDLLSGSTLSDQEKVKSEEALTIVQMQLRTRPAKSVFLEPDENRTSTGQT
jgi:hypothetical protein